MPDNVDAHISQMTWSNYPTSEDEILLCSYDYFVRFDPWGSEFLNWTGLDDLTGWDRWASDVSATDFGEAYLATSGPYGGVQVYDHRTNRIFNYSMNNMSEYTSFTEIEVLSTPDGFVFYAGDAGNPRGLVICHVPSHNTSVVNETDGLVSDWITYLKVREPYLLIGTDEGFSIFDIDTGTVVLSQSRDDENQTFRVNAMDYYPFAKRVYVGTDNGLLVYEIVDSVAQLVRSRLTTVDGLPHNRINTVERDINTKRVYLGTYEGLCYFGLDTDEIELTTLADESDFDGYDVAGILISRTGNLYLALSPRIGGSPAAVVRFSPAVRELPPGGGFLVWLVAVIAVCGSFIWAGYPAIRSRRPGVGDSSSVVIRAGDKPEAVRLVSSIVNGAKEYIKLRDNYPSAELMRYLRQAPREVTIQLLTTMQKPSSKREAEYREYELFARELSETQSERSGFEVRLTSEAKTHARNLITESDCWTADISFKELGGRKMGMVSHQSGVQKEEIEADFDLIWRGSHELVLGQQDSGNSHNSPAE